MLYSPYWGLMNEALEHIDHPNLMILKFEDMKADPLKQIRIINDFIGSNLTDQQLKKVKYFF